MGRLIRFELRKLFKSRYFYVIASISVVFIIISGLTLLVAATVAKENGIDGVTAPSIYAFTKSAIGGTFSILVGAFVAIAATEDNAMGTTKNILARGYSRTKIFIAKYIVSFLGVLMISILTILVAYLFALGAFAHAEVTDNVAVVILGQLFGLLAYHAIFYAISTGFGKIAPALVLCLIGPMGVTLILTLVDTAITVNEAKVSQYWVSSLLDNFTATTDPAKYGICFGLLAAYFAVAVAIGYLITRNKEY